MLGICLAQMESLVKKQRTIRGLEKEADQKPRPNQKPGPRPKQKPRPKQSMQRVERALRMMKKNIPAHHIMSRMLRSRERKIQGQRRDRRKSLKRKNLPLAGGRKPRSQLPDGMYIFFNYLYRIYFAVWWSWVNSQDRLILIPRRMNLLKSQRRTRDPSRWEICFLSNSVRKDSIKS